MTENINECIPNSSMFTNKLELNIKDEPNDDYATLLLPIKNEFLESSAILSSENVIIKEELIIEEVLQDDKNINLQNCNENKELNENDPLTLPTPEKKIICKICAATFTECKDLASHLCRTSRTGDKTASLQTPSYAEFVHECLPMPNTTFSFPCTICFKCFDSIADIKKHLFTVHRPITTSDFDRIFCDFCMKCFDENEFEVHLPCHSIDYRCIFCLMAMPTKQHFLQHYLTWKRSSSYQCNICDTYTQDMNLKSLTEHMMSHGIKGFCRCSASPCLCYKSYYLYKNEFVKKNNILVNNKNLKNNQIREQQNNSINANKINCPECNNKPSTSKSNISSCCNSANRNYNELNEEEQAIEKDSEDNADLVVTTQKYNAELKACYQQKNIVDVIIKRNHQGYGFTLVGEQPCKLANVIPESPAQLAGLQDGNAIIHINGLNVLSLSHNTIVDLIKRCTGNLCMKILMNVPIKVVRKPSIPVIKAAPKTAPEIVPETTEVQCNICNMKYEKQCYLNAHLIVMHRPTILPGATQEEEVEGEIEKRFFCYKCGNSFMDNFSLMYHDPCAVKNLRRCTICSLRKPSLGHYELHHLLYKSDKYLCTLCSPHYQSSLRAMNEHRKKIHNKTGVFECIKCRIDFAKFSEIKQHMMGHFKNDEIMDPFTYRLKGKTIIFKCDVCQKVTDSAKWFKRHKSAHIFPCEVCTEKFSSLAELKQHLLQHKEKPHVCHICAKSYLLKQQLYKHLREHDLSKRKRIVCDECGRVFMRFTSIICHMASHTNENLFQCCVCKLKFVKQGLLATHMIEHNKDQTNPNKCDICNKYFTHKCKLILHLKTHTKLKNKVPSISVKEEPSKLKRKKTSKDSCSAPEDEQLKSNCVENKRKSGRKRVQKNAYVDIQSEDDDEEMIEN